jgi:hypothetical protein
MKNTIFLFLKRRKRIISFHRRKKRNIYLEQTKRSSLSFFYNKQFELVMEIVGRELWRRRSIPFQSISGVR